MEQETYVAFPANNNSAGWMYRSNDLEDLIKRVRWMMDGTSKDKEVLIAKVIGSVREVKTIDFEKFEREVVFPLNEDDVEEIFKCR